MPLSIRALAVQAGTQALAECVLPRSAHHGHPGTWPGGDERLVGALAALDQGQGLRCDG